MGKKKSISVLTQLLISNALLILVFAVGGMAINSNYSAILRQEVSMQAMQDLKKSADLFESRLTELGNCAYTIAQDASVVALSRAETLSIDEYALLYRLNKQIQSAYQSNGFIDSILIWFQKNGSIWTDSGFLDASLAKAAGRSNTINGVPLDVFFREQMTANKASQLELMDVLRAGKRTMQLVYTFHLNPLSNFKADAYGCILIDMTQAMRFLSFPQYEQEGAAFRMAEPDGKQIYPVAGVAASAPFSNERLSGESITPIGDDILFSYQPGANGLCYQLSLPVAYIDSLVWAGQRTSLIVTILAIGLTALLAFVLARRNAKPVFQLVQLAGGNSKDRNEFHALHDSLSQMLKDRSQMEASLENYLALQKNAVFSKLLSYGFRSEEKAVEALAKVEILPDAASYGAAYLHFTSPETLEGQAAHLVLTTLFSRLIPGLMHVYPMTSNAYALIYESPSPETLKSQLEYALLEFKQQYQLIVTVVVGPKVASLLELPDSLQLARRAYYATELSEHGKVIAVSEQAGKPEAAWYLAEVHRHRLISLCQAGDYDMLSKVLRQFFEERAAKYAPGKLETVQLAYDLRSLFIQLQQQTAGISLESVALALNALPNSEDYHQLLEEALALFKVFCQQIAAYKENSSHRLYERIKSHIKANYTDPGLSLVGIADAFNLNDKYLSQFYKKEGHVNLAAEIEELRLNQAITLMKDADATLAEICAACGYASLNSFYKAFRRVYGVSPSEYRQGLKKPVS